MPDCLHILKDLRAPILNSAHSPDLNLSHKRWRQTVAMSEEQDIKNKGQMAQDLLENCKLDTITMVGIYRFLKRLVT